MRSKKANNLDLNTYPGILNKQFKRWTKMKVWGTDLSEIKFNLKIEADRESSGVGTKDGITVTAGSDIADGYATLLHELAHAACFITDKDYGWGDVHEDPWRSLFVKAAKRITKQPIKILPGHNQQQVHEAVRKAFYAFLDLAKS